VISHTTKQFRKLLASLPKEVRQQAREMYVLWNDNPWHASLQFKRIHAVKPIYSARINKDWRVVCIRNGDTVIWYWVGSHSDYNTLIKKL
jgi:mRNA-degrading endonuclease RelE of RelBE toxin-antitoxin system